MTTVRFPAMRRYVMDALAALSDEEYQQRVWIEHRYPDERFFDDLRLNVHLLYDDCEVLPDPRPMLGAVVVDDDEMPRLVALDAALGPLLDELGEAPDEAFVSHPNWPAVRAAAARALSAMVRAGAYYED